MRGRRRRRAFPLADAGDQLPLGIGQVAGIASGPPSRPARTTSTSRLPLVFDPHKSGSWGAPGNLARRYTAVQPPTHQAANYKGLTKRSRDVRDTGTAGDLHVGEACSLRRASPRNGGRDRCRTGLSPASCLRPASLVRIAQAQQASLLSSNASHSRLVLTLFRSGGR
jgi:hypothetical protein